MVDSDAQQCCLHVESWLHVAAAHTKCLHSALSDSMLLLCRQLDDWCRVLAQL